MLLPAMYVDVQQKVRVVFVDDVDTSERLEIKIVVVSKLTTFIELKEGSVDAPDLPVPDVSVQSKEKKIEHFQEDIMGNISDTNESQPSEIASSEVDRCHTEAPLPLACKIHLLGGK